MSFDDVLQEEVDGMTYEELTIMKRLLEAEREEDISDIPTEKIIKMFEFIQVFANSLSRYNPFANSGSSTGSFETRLLSLPSANRKRRVI